MDCQDLGTRTFRNISKDLVLTFFFKIGVKLFFWIVCHDKIFLGGRPLL